MHVVCRTGWAYPWAVRIRLCDLMLRGMFDTLDEASYVDSKDALLQLLQNRVWPLLGISTHIHNTIYAWIHFRQFAVTGRRFLQHMHVSDLKGSQCMHLAYAGKLFSYLLLCPLL